MKRFFSMLMVLALCVGMVPAVLAEEAATGVQKLFDEGEILSVAVSDGTLYLAGESTLHRYEAGVISEVGAMPAAGAPEESYVLLDGDDGLWAFNKKSGEVGKIVNGNFEIVKQLNYAPMQGSEGVMTIFGFCRNGNILYLLAFDEKTYTGGQEQLLRYDLTTGEAQRDTLTFAIALAAYGDTAMVLRQDVNRMMAEETGMMLESLNADGAYDETIASNFDFSMGAPAQAENGTVYLSGGGQYKRVENEALTNLGSLGVSNGMAAKAFIVGEEYIVHSAEGVFACPLAGTAQAATTLTISGGSMDNASVAFMQENPDIALNFDSRQINGSEAIRNDMVAGTANVDIYVIHELLGLRTMIDKGYVAEFTSDALLADAGNMYGVLQEALMRDGKLYGYPHMLRMNNWFVNRTAWNEIYGEDREVPTTFEEFFDFIEEWETEYAEEYPEYQFTQLYAGKNQLFSSVLEQYALMHASADTPLSYNAPEFIAAAERLGELDVFSVDMENVSEETIMQMQEILMKPALIDMVGLHDVLQYTQANETDEDVYEAIAPMVFVKGETPALRVDMFAYIVNPASPNLEAAMQYIEYKSQNSGDALRVMISPQENTPVRYAGFAKTMEDIEKRQTDLQGRYDAADDTEKVDIQAEMDRVAKEKEDAEANNWQASAEGIAHYRELAQYMTLGRNASFLYSSGDNSGATEELGDILTRYFEGQMSLQQMVVELDKKIQMIYMEGN